MPDRGIWSYARVHSLTIITRDGDFSERIMLEGAPSRVIHIRLGNMRLRQMRIFLGAIWNEILELSEKSILVNVFADKIEGIQ